MSGGGPICETNFRAFLAPDSEVPPDVTFRIQESVPGDFLGVVARTQEVRAHRMLLAGVSPTFRGLFFGARALPIDQEVVNIEDTTAAAFSAMIESIYAPPGVDFSLASVSCPKALFHILALATKYQLSPLVDEAKQALNKVVISPENMLFTAMVAKQFAAFEDVSKMLIKKCQCFLTTQLKTAEDVYAFILQSKVSYPEVDFELLHFLLADKADNLRSCANCLRSRADCLEGSPLTALEDPPVLREGVRLRVSYCPDIESAPVGCTGRVSGMFTREAAPAEGFNPVDQFPISEDPTQAYITLDTLPGKYIPVRLGGAPCTLSFACPPPPSYQ